MTESYRKNKSQLCRKWSILFQICCGDIAEAHKPLEHHELTTHPEVMLRPLELLDTKNQIIPNLATDQYECLTSSLALGQRANWGRQARIRAIPILRDEHHLHAPGRLVKIKVTMHQPRPRIVGNKLNRQPSAVGHTKRVHNGRVHEIERFGILRWVVDAIASGQDTEVVAMQVDRVVLNSGSVDVLQDDSHVVTVVELPHPRTPGSKEVVVVDSGEIDLQRRHPVGEVGLENTIFTGCVSFKNVGALGIIKSDVLNHPHDLDRTRLRGNTVHKSYPNCI